MDRISVIGTSGTGKTTLARRLAKRLELPHLELDAVFHQPGWTPLPDDDFIGIVRDLCAGERWVVCGKYRQTRPIVFGRADTIVCLDHNRLRQTLRATWRTVRRVARHEELWNGNRERWRGLWIFGPAEESIVRWTWENVPRGRSVTNRVEGDFPVGPVDPRDAFRLDGALIDQLTIAPEPHTPAADRGPTAVPRRVGLVPPPEAGAAPLVRDRPSVAQLPDERSAAPRSTSAHPPALP